MTGADVVTAARAYLGARWTHQGRHDSAMDCAGLIIKVAHDLKLLDFDKTDYGRQSTDETMLELCRAHLDEVRVYEAQPGDVAVMRFQANRHIGFFGDYVHGGLSLIHAYSRAPRKVVEHGFSHDWLRMQDASLLSVFRFKGIA